MDRRDFVKKLGLGAGYMVLLPTVSACTSTPAKDDAVPTDGPTQTDATMANVPPLDRNGIPTARPVDWDPIAFNEKRGLAGAIPETYHASITGEGGESKHLGKHLPYVPAMDAVAPVGFIPLMWGDPAKGHAKHPNAPANESNNNEGHWYDWIRVGKVDGDSIDELQSTFKGWPDVVEGSTGAYLTSDGGAITDDSGKNTVYLVALPKSAKPGDTLRIYAHCLTHGEYVDFITL